jgi:hypothetical protein
VNNCGLVWIEESAFKKALKRALNMASFGKNTSFQGF